MDCHEILFLIQSKDEDDNRFDDPLTFHTAPLSG